MQAFPADLPFAWANVSAAVFSGYAGATTGGGAFAARTAATVQAGSDRPPQGSFIDLNDGFGEGDASMPLIDGASAPWTLAMWIFVSAPKSNTVLLSCSAGTQDGLALFFNAQGVLSYKITGAPAVVAFGRIQSWDVAQHGHWFHFTMQHTTSAVNIFINGESFRSGIAAPVLAAVPRGNCYLGGKTSLSQPEFGTHSEWFEGRVAGFAVWPQTLLSSNAIKLLAGPETAAILLAQTAVSYARFMSFTPPAPSITLAPATITPSLPYSLLHQVTLNPAMGLPGSLSLNTLGFFYPPASPPPAFNIVSWGAAVPWSMALWWRLALVGGAAPVQTLVYLEAGGGAKSFELALIDTVTGVISLRVKSGGVSIIDAAITPATRAPTSWNHLLLTYAPLGAAIPSPLRAYANGALSYEGSLAPFFSGPCSLAQLGMGASPVSMFSGSLAGFTLWPDRALTARGAQALSAPQVASLVWTLQPDALLLCETNQLCFEVSKSYQIGSTMQLKATQAGVSTIVTPILTVGAGVTTGCVSLVPANVSQVVLSFELDPTAAGNNPFLLVPEPLVLAVFDPSRVTTAQLNLTAVTVRQITDGADFFTSWEEFDPWAMPNTCVLVQAPSNIESLWMAIFDGTNSFCDFKVDLVDPHLAASGSVDFVGLTNPRAFTLAAWLRMHRLSNPVEAVFFSDFTSTPLQNQIMFGFSNGQLAISVQRAGATLCAAQAPTTAQTDRWMHIAATFSSLQGCAVFLNGQLVASSPIAPLVVTQQFVVSALRTVYLLGSNGSSPIYADIATFGLWNRPLEIGEIRLMGTNLPQQIVPPPSPAPTVALRYAAQTDVVRTAMFQYRATSVMPLPTPVNLAAADPTTGRALYASTLPTWLEPGNFSASMWVSFNLVNTMDPLLFVSSAPSPVPFSFHVFTVLNGASQPVPRFTAVQRNVSYCDVTADFMYGALDLNTWFHVAVSLAVVPEMGPPTLARALVQCTIFVNGKRVGVHEQNTYDDTVLPAPLGPAGIGAVLSCSGCPTGFPFPTMNGYVSAFSMFNRVLSGREVQTLYNSPPPPVLGSTDVAPAARSVVNDIYSSSLYFLPMDSPLNPARLGFVADTQEAPWVTGSQGDVATGVAVFGPSAVSSFQAAGWLDLSNATHISPLRLFPRCFTTAEVSVSLWVNVRGSPSPGSAPCLFDHGIWVNGATPLTTTHAIRLALESSGPVSLVTFALTRCGATPAVDCIFVCDPAVMRAVLAPGSPVDWRLVTVTLDSQGYCSLFVQGLLQVRSRTAQTDTTALVRGLLKFGQAPQRTAAFLGACAAVNVSASTMTDVRMSHFAFWSRALSMREIGVMWQDPPFFVRRQIHPTEALRDALFVPAPAASWALEAKFPPSLLMLRTEPAVSGVLFAQLGGPTSLKLMDSNDNAPTKAVLPRVGIPGESSTLSMWVMLPGPALPPAVDILACARNSAALDLISIKLTNSQLIVSHQRGLGLGFVPPIETPSGTVVAGQWFLLSLVLDFAAQATRLHYNSALIGFQSWGYSMAPAMVRRDACYIAANENGATVADLIYVSGVKFFRAALSIPQLLRLFNSPPGAVAPILQRESYTTIPVARRSSAYSLSFVNTTGSCPVHMACDSVGEFGLPIPGPTSLSFNDLADNNASRIQFGANIFPLKAFSPHLTDGLSWTTCLMMSPVNSASLFSCGTTPAGFGVFDVFYDITSGPAGSFGVELPGVPLPARFQLVAGSIDLSQWTHIAVTVTKELIVSLYLNGRLAQLQPGIARVQASSELGLFTLAPPDGLTFNGWNDCGFGRPSVAYPQMSGRLDSLEMFSRVLSDADINVLARNALGNTARSAAPFGYPSTLLDRAVASWRFQRLAVSGAWTLATAPSGVGSVAAVAGTAPIDLALASHNPDVAAPSATFPVLAASSEHAVVIWALVRGLSNADGVFSNWPGCTLFDIAKSATGTATTDDEYMLQVTSTRALQLVYLSRILTTVPNVVTPWVWMHIAVVQGAPSVRLPTRLYVNGALVGWSTTFSPSFSGGARPNAWIGKKVVGTAGPMQLSVAHFAVFDSFTMLSDFSLLDLVTNPPANIAGALGTSIDILMRSAAAFYNCTEPPGVNAGWVPGLAPNSGLCVFNGLPKSASGVGPTGSYLRLDGTTDLKSSQPMPTQFAHVETSISNGWTFHWQLQATSAPRVGNISLLWCDAPGSIEGVPAPGHISIIMDFAQLGSIRYKQYNALATDPVCDVSVPLAMQGGLLQRQLQIAVVIAIQDANTLLLFIGINGVRAGPATCVNAGGVLSTPVVLDRECRFGTNTDVTGERFHGRLARFAWWTRMLQMNELTVLEANAAVADVGAAAIELPSPSPIVAPASLFEFLTPFALGSGQTLTDQGPVAGRGFTFFTAMSGADLMNGLPFTVGPRPAVLLAGPGAAFTFTLWVRIPSTTVFPQKLFTFFSDPTEYLTMGPAEFPSTSATWLLQFFKGGNAVCNMGLTLKSIGAFSHIAVRYTSPVVGQIEQGRVDVWQNGVSVLSAQCTGMLSVGTIYSTQIIGNVSGMPSTAAPMPLELCHTALYLSALQPVQVAMLANNPPANLPAHSYFKVQAPTFLSSLYPVGNITLQPFSFRALDGPVTVEILPSVTAVVYPSTLVFSSAFAQTLTVVAAQISSAVTITFRVLRGNGTELSGATQPGIAPVCIAVSNPDNEWSAGASAAAVMSAAGNLEFAFTNMISTPSAAPANEPAPYSSSTFVTRLNVAQLVGGLTNEVLSLTQPPGPIAGIWPPMPSAAQQRGLTVSITLMLSTDKSVNSEENTNAYSTTIFEWRRVTGVAPTNHMWLRVSAGELRLSLFDAAPAEICYVATPFANLPTGVPVNLVITVSPALTSGAAQYCSLYVQGVLVGSRLSTALWPFTILQNSASVGCTLTPFAGQRCLVARVATVYMWSRQLRAQDIAALLDYPAQVAGVMSLTPFPTLLASLAPTNASNWVLYDAVSLTSGPRAVNFLSSMESMPLSIQTDYSSTFLFWLRVTAPSGGSTEADFGTRLFDCAMDGALTGNVMLIAGVNRTLSWQIYVGAEWSGAVTTPQFAFLYANWMHVAVVTGTRNALPYTRLYVNSVLAATSSQQLFARAMAGPRNTCFLAGDSEGRLVRPVDVAHFAYLPSVALTAGAILSAASFVPAVVYSGPLAFSTPTQAFREIDACAGDLSGLKTPYPITVQDMMAGSVIIPQLTDLDFASTWTAATPWVRLQLSWAPAFPSFRKLRFVNSPTSPADVGIVHLFMDSTMSVRIGSFVPPPRSTLPFYWNFPSPSVLFSTNAIYMLIVLAANSTGVVPPFELAEISLYTTTCLPASAGIPGPQRVFNTNQLTCTGATPVFGSVRFAPSLAGKTSSKPLPV